MKTIMQVPDCKGRATAGSMAEEADGAGRKSVVCRSSVGGGEEVMHVVAWRRETRLPAERVAIKHTPHPDGNV